MKNNKKIIVFVLLIICLIASILLFKYFVKTSQKNEENEFELEEIVWDVNSATNRNFIESISFENDVSEMEDMQFENIEIENKQIDNFENVNIDNIPISINEKTTYILARDSLLNEYFLIIKEPNETQIKEFDNFIKRKEKEQVEIKYGKNSKYIYLIKSDEFYSTIEGIIRSYIY